MTNWKLFKRSCCGLFSVDYSTEIYLEKLRKTM